VPVALNDRMLVVDEIEDRSVPGHALSTGTALAKPVPAALAPGSYVVLSAGRGDSDRADSGFGAYSAGGTRVYNHSVPEFASFFGSLELVPPGVVDAREWRPDWEQPVHLPPREGQVIVGVACTG
jgi:S-adenosyl methyltransferase